MPKLNFSLIGTDSEIDKIVPFKKFDCRLFDLNFDFFGWNYGPFYLNVEAEELTKFHRMLLLHIHKKFTWNSVIKIHVNVHLVYTDRGSYQMQETRSLNAIASCRSYVGCKRLFDNFNNNSNEFADVAFELKSLCNMTPYFCVQWEAGLQCTVNFSDVRAGRLSCSFWCIRAGAAFKIYSFGNFNTPK